MSQRLSKLEQYLDDSNYEMAISQFSEKPQQLNEPYLLSLARAYSAQEQYLKSKQLCHRLVRHSDPMIFFEANILHIKNKFLLQENVEEEIKNFKHKVNLDKVFNAVHKEMVNEIQFIVTKDQAFQRGMLHKKNQVKNQGRRVIELLNKQERENPLEEGMPMFIISERWFEKWLYYTEVKESNNPEYPGPISHFEILDHRFNTFYDRRTQKKYTNYILLHTSRYKLIPKNCWEILKNSYGGIDLKRFNISVMDKPTEIITEVFLKQLTIKDQRQKINYILQITKKETFKGVLKKIQENWAYAGYIYEEKQNNRRAVNEGAVLEEIDTNGRVYVYSAQKPKNQNTVKVKEMCGKCNKTEDLRFCQCKTIKYCGMPCLKEDRDRHRKKCQLELSHIKQKSAILDNFKLVQKSFDGKKGLVGLRNLGNTCYMNSGLQCLSNTRELTQYFMSNKFLQDVNYTNPLGQKGNLACAYAELIRQMWTGNDSPVSPYNLKKMIGKFSGQFSGFGQQDSQELISQLIDGLQEDLNLVKKKETFEASQRIMPDEEASLESELNYAKRYRSFIRDLMVGQFKSTVVCGDCNRKSIVFDPYMLISLPIPSTKEEDVFFISSDLQKKAARLKFEYDHHTSCGELREEVGRYERKSMGENSSLLLTLVDLDTNEIIEEVKSNEEIYRKIGANKDKPQFLCYQLPQKLPGHTIYRIEFVFYSERKKAQSKLSYPKFMNIPNGISHRQLNKRLAETLLPYLDERKKIDALSFIEDVSIQDTVIKMRLKEKLKMLICDSERFTLKLCRKGKLGLEECLKNFESPEILEDKNEWYCNKCKKFVKATKQMQIYKSNTILVLAFKRFNRMWKVRDLVDFPIQQLNIGPFIKSNVKKKPINYELYGVVNHYGTMGGGHYTAYCKNFLNNRWFEFDDSRVSEVDPRSVITENAYVLFYHLI